MHAKTDSEVTSLAPSSPTRSPRRPVYYVQSPSRDSHDGEKTATSFHSTPGISPMGSPPHSQSSLGLHSSSTRFSGSLKPDRSRKIASGGKSGKQWNKEIAVIEEEGLLEDEARRKSLPRRCYFPVFVLGFFLLFTLFSLILWGASKPQKPKITMKSITFEHVGIQAGSDSSGVATDMVTVNATVALNFRNTATFFGVHVTSTPLDLAYSQVTIASGSVKRFYQSRSSRRTVKVSVIGSRIPLYGSGAGLSSSTGTLTLPVSLSLRFTVRSQAYVLGKLVKPKFYKSVDCLLTFDPKKLGKPISLTSSCTYQ
uniref:Late embryogenesis abundant protein LEA-2 subgroup domain-containing protein n=1 Tax=Kalanchoe fedtschenkoi TaxID=63787 RepID=A0A7N0UVP7_KALFE